MKDDQVVIRPMVTSDIEAARELWAASNGVEISEGDHPSELAIYLERNPAMSHVAYRHGVLVGAVLAGHDGRRGFLYHLAVHPSCARRGVGRELVNRSILALKAAGIVRALLFVVADNAAGVAFWTRCGWSMMDDAEGMYREL